MIGFFTDPYPDELLYSAIARYCRRAKYPNQRQVLNELFGSVSISAVFDFPTRLNNFIAALPKTTLYNLEDLINKNSLLPFYAPFLPIDRLNVIRREMRSSANNKIQARLGTRVKQVKNPHYLRFCPVCVNNHRENIGETYWHRLHQLAGILVCSKHKCFLEDSRLKWNRKLSSQFYLADKFISEVTPRYIDENNQNHKIILKIARDAEWLLSQDNLHLDAGVLRNRYFNVLLKRGYAYYNGRVRHNKLLKACTEFYSSDLLTQIGRTSNRDCWLSILVDSHKSGVVYHPIRHLLLMTFLGLTAKEFFTSFVEFKPFGDPPYPCLNKASEHYGEMRINQCEIFDNLSKNSTRNNRPIAYFKCDCGFIYQRIGPDNSESDKGKYSYVREYGSVWENKLAKLWSDLSLSGSKVGRELGVSELTVRRHAIRLNLPMNTANTRNLQGYSRHRKPEKSLSQMKQNYRKEWLQIAESNHYKNREQLIKIANFLYLWLKKNDSEWFEKHLPPNSKAPKNKRVLNWKEIDKKLSKNVSAICNEIYNIQAFPVRVSITEIIKRIGNKCWIEKRKQKLPLTDNLLSNELESLEDYMIRKIKWAGQHFIKEKVVPTEHQLKVKAAVRNKNSENSTKVKKMLSETVSQIKKSILLKQKKG